MNSLFRLVFVAVLLALAVVTNAQETYTSTNKKAIKLYEKAIASYDTRNNGEALSDLEAALERDPEFVEAHILMSDIYIEQNRVEDAIAALRTAVQINPDFFPNNWFFLAELEWAQANYTAALECFDRFVSYPNRDKEMLRRARFGQKCCKFAEEAIKYPVPFEPQNLGPSVNTPLMEYFPCITADESLLFFTRRLEDPASETGYNEDFYISRRLSGKWQEARNVGGPVNSILNEGAPTLAPNGQVVVFTACAGFNGYGRNRQGLGSCDLFYTRRAGDRWMPPQNLGENVNSRHWESQPSLSADGRTMYFVRGRYTREGIKEQDIYMSTLDKDGQWTKAVPLPGKVNSPGREVSVHIHPDGQTLYFASDGHPGMGGLDLFVSRLDGTGKWGKPVNLGYPINTHMDENSLLVNAKGNVAYFASDREGGAGGLDLYSFEMPRQHQPVPVNYLRGRVFEKGTTKPINALFELVDVETNRLVASSMSDPANGEFLICLPANREYALSVQHPDYLFWTENFLVDGEASRLNPYQKDVPLSKPSVNERIVLNNIFFDTDKFDLKPKSQSELQVLKEYLEKNAMLKVEIGGHTDNVGDDSSNQVLSDNRAKAVRDWLIENGIAADRLTHKGYGETEPIASNDTEEGRAQNRRTELKIIGLK